MIIVNFILQHYLAVGLPITSVGLVIIILGWIVSKLLSM